MTRSTLLLSRDDIKQCLNMAQCLRIVEQVYRFHGEGRVVMPPKLGLNMISVQGTVYAMPAYLPDVNAAGLKWAGVWTKNIAKALPFVMAEIMLIDPETGLLKAVLEGGYITNLRTGAATGIAAKYLAKKDSEIVTIIGAGAQGRMQLRALSQQFAIEEVRVADRLPQQCEKFVRDMHIELGVAIRIAPDARAAVSAADIVVTATTADEVLVKREWVAPGAFIASVGSNPELDPGIILAAEKLVVDSWDQNKQRGELARLVTEGLISDQDIYGELGEVVAGKLAGRENAEEISVVCLLGLGSLDVGCANYVYEQACKRGLGKTFNFEQAE